MKEQEFFKINNLHKTTMCCKNCKYSKSTISKWWGISRCCNHPDIDERERVIPEPIDDFDICNKFEIGKTN